MRLRAEKNTSRRRARRRLRRVPTARGSLPRAAEEAEHFRRFFARADMVSGSDVIPLDPFMSLHDCALCQHAELYYPETLTRDTAHLLSPNTPHTSASTRVAEDLHIALGHLGFTAVSTT